MLKLWYWEKQQYLIEKKKKREENMTLRKLMKLKKKLVIGIKI